MTWPIFNEKSTAKPIHRIIVMINSPTLKRGAYALSSPVRVAGESCVTFT